MNRSLYAWREFLILFKFLKKNTTTSIHSLCADMGLIYPFKLLHYFLNWINNLFPFYNIDDSLEIRDFKYENLKESWINPNFFLTSSPARKLSNLFWLGLPWNKIKEELGEINILDTGCGTGNYGKKLIHLSNNKISRYTGLDIFENKSWIKLKEKSSIFQFFKYNGKCILNHMIKDINFFMTQSAIEHFDEDLSFFYQIRDYVISSKKNVIQVHLFPSRVCLNLYPLHGVRQYTPRTISKITKLFKGFSYAILFNLGGKFCNDLHTKYITNSINRKKKILCNIKPKTYDKLLFRAIQKDTTCNQKNPTFYALVIHSNWKKKIF